MFMSGREDYMFDITHQVEIRLIFSIQVKIILILQTCFVMLSWTQTYFLIYVLQKINIVLFNILQKWMQKTTYKSSY